MVPDEPVVAPVVTPPAAVTDPPVTPPADPPPPPPPTAQPTDWRSSWPENLKVDETLGRFDSSADLAQSYLEVRTKVGADTIAIPGKDATDEQRAEFWGKLGKPEKPEGYELPGELPEGVTLSEDEVKAVWPKFHELNLSTQQAAGILRLYAERELADATGLAEQVQTDRKTANDALRKDWGEAYQERIGMAQNAADTLGIRQHLNDQGFGDDPVMLKALAEVGKWMAEDQVRGRGASSFQPSVEESKLQIEKVLADPAKMKARGDRDDPAHKGVLEELDRLYKIAYPGEHTIGEKTIAVGVR